METLLRGRYGLYGTASETPRRRCFLRGAGLLLGGIALPGMTAVRLRPLATRPCRNSRYRYVPRRRDARRSEVLTCRLGGRRPRRTDRGPPHALRRRTADERVSRPAFASSRVRHVGDVAGVITGTRAQAEDAAEAVFVEYEVLRITDVACARPTISRLPQFGSNTVFDIEKGSRTATEQALANAHRVVEMTLPSNRIAGSPMEPRSYLCDFDTATERYTFYAQPRHPCLKRWLAVYTLFVPEHKIRVIAPDVGGGFGLKVHYSVEAPTVTGPPATVADRWPPRDPNA